MSNFQKIAIGLLLGIPIILLTALAYFATTNYQAVKPAILPSSQDITTIFENRDQEDNQPGQNNTQFPLTVPDNFSIAIFAQGLGSPRVLKTDPAGRLVVSVPASGKILALEDLDGDGKSEQTKTIVEGLNKPHGLLFKCDDMNENCKLYVAEVTQVSVFDYNKQTAQATNKQKHLDLPVGGRHSTRTLHQANIDGREQMLISVGSTCDVCYESNPIHGSVLINDFISNRAPIFASGLRNAVFLATHPVTGQTWVTEMGRDQLGDELPPDEVNILEQNKDYGWPECYGKNVFDTKFNGNKGTNCSVKTPSHIDLPAHSAPLGLGFIPEEGWPEEYWHDLLVSYHGSWNRFEPTGYKVARFQLDEQGNVEGSEDFIFGWLEENGTALGRPVDLLIQPGGKIYVSDDKSGVIYLVSYQGPTN